MPCILKQRTTTSPGIITFTHNEALAGLPKYSKKVRNYLRETARKRQWVYGVHIQGYCDWLKEWPLEEWQSFIMWTNPDAAYLRNVPKEKLIPLNCINFTPNLSLSGGMKKKYDLFVICRASPIKRGFELLKTLRRLMDEKPGLKVIFLCPDGRDVSLGEKTYDVSSLDRRMYEEPMKMFSSEEKKNISFICSSVQSYGNFPVADEVLFDLLAQSRFLLSLSHYEGVPRAFIESLSVNTPVIVSENLITGIQYALNEKNSLKVKDDEDHAARQILEALNHYERFSVDTKVIREWFGEEFHFDVLKKRLSEYLLDFGAPIEGEWYFNELQRRLACHGQKHNSQFMNNEALFFDWIEKIEHENPYDEDRVLGVNPLDDTSRFSIDKLAFKLGEKAQKIRAKLSQPGV